MPLELKKATPTRLRSLGFDERWLQDRIEEDPSLLGLGDWIVPWVCQVCDCRFDIPSSGISG